MADTTIRTIHVPRAVYSEDGRTATIGLPGGHPVPLRVTQCGDGLHVFKPLSWRTIDDWLCVCGNIEPGYPMLGAINRGAETILIPDPIPEAISDDDE